MIRHILIFGTTALLLILIIASLTTSPFLWGLNHAGFLPAWIIILTIATSVLGWLILTGYAIKDESSTKTRTPSFARILILAGVLLVLIGLMYSFQSATALWGDGYLRADEIDNGRMLHFTEPLDKFVQFMVYYGFTQEAGFSSEDSHRTVSIFGGVLYFLLAFWFLGRYPDRRFERFLYGGLLFFSGLIQLFFGYVESYSLSTPLFLTALGTALIRLKNGQSILPASILYFIACLFHMSLAVYFPAFLVIAILQWKKHKQTADRFSLIATALIPALLAVILLAVRSTQEVGKLEINWFEYLFLSFLPNQTGYWIFSATHILDVLNELLLVAPAGIVLLVAFLRPKRLEKSMEFIFLAILCVCGLVFMLLFNTSFALARDWDLFSSIALPVNLLAGYVTIQHLRDRKRFDLRLIFLPLLPAVWIAVSFVLTNSRQEATVDRYETAIEMTEYGRHLNLEALASYYKAVDNDTRYIELLEEAQKYQNNPRYLFKIGHTKLSEGKPAEALDYFFEALEIDPDYVSALQYVAMTYASLGKNDPRLYEQAEKFFHLVLQKDPDFAPGYYNLAWVLIETGRLSEARRNLRKAIEYDPDYSMAYANLARVFALENNLDSAEYYYLKLIDMEPNDLGSYLNLVKTYHSAGENERGYAILNEAEKRFKNSVYSIEIARTYLLLGATDKAIELLTQISESEQHPLPAFITLANVYYMTGKPEAGIKTLSRAGQYHLEPSQLVHISEAFLQMEARDSARTYLHESIKRDSSFVTGYLKLSMFYLLEGKRQTAMRVLEQGAGKIDDSHKRDSLVSRLNKLRSAD